MKFQAWKRESNRNNGYGWKKKHPSRKLDFILIGKASEKRERKRLKRKLQYWG